MGGHGEPGRWIWIWCTEIIIRSTTTAFSFVYIGLWGKLDNGGGASEALSIYLLLIIVAQFCTTCFYPFRLGHIGNEAYLAGFRGQKSLAWLAWLGTACYLYIFSTSLIPNLLS